MGLKDRIDKLRALARPAQTALGATVVVSVHNDLPYLHACLNSLRNQAASCNALEAILVDHASTDGSANICDRFASDNGWCRVMHAQPEEHPGTVMNAALAHARGRYVFIAEGDIYFRPDAIKGMLGKASEHDCDILIPKPLHIASSRFPELLFEKSCFDATIATPHVLESLDSCKLFKREFLVAEDLSFGADGYFDDMVFVAQALSAAKRIAIPCDHGYYGYLTPALGGQSRFHAMLSDADKAVATRRFEACSSFERLISLYNHMERDKQEHIEVSALFEKLAADSIDNIVSWKSSEFSNGNENEGVRRWKQRELGNICRLLDTGFAKDAEAFQHTLIPALKVALVQRTSNPDIHDELAMALRSSDPGLVFSLRGSRLLCSYTSSIDPTCSIDVDTTDMRLYDYLIVGASWKHDDLVFAGELYYPARTLPPFEMLCLLKGDEKHRMSFPATVLDSDLAPMSKKYGSLYGRSFTCKVSLEDLRRAGEGYREAGVIPIEQPARWDLFIANQGGKPKMRFGAHRTKESHGSFLEGASVLDGSLFTAHETAMHNMTVYESTESTDTAKAPFTRAKQDCAFNRQMMEILHEGRFKDACDLANSLNAETPKPEARHIEDLSMGGAQ